jgi:Ser/Thr protein kinase RdoA (MazF antagonist)
MGAMVVRAWPVEGPQIAHLETIHGWLREAADLGFLPVPVAAQDGRTVQQCGDRCWEIAPWLDGEAGMVRPPASQQVQAAFRALANLHQRLSRHAAVAQSPGRELEELASDGFDRLEALLDQASPSEHHVAGHRWLVLARATAPQLRVRLHDAARLKVPLQPCLRDARPEHFLFDRLRLTGLVDFGAMGIETVAADLARLIGEWFSGNDMFRTTALTAYEQVRPLDPSEAALVAPFEAAADLLIAGHWLRWHFLEHRRFDDPGAVARGIARGLDRLERLVERRKPAGLMA